MIMDTDTVQHILKYYRHLMGSKEKCSPFMAPSKPFWPLYGPFKAILAPFHDPFIVYTKRYKKYLYQ